MSSRARKPTVSVVIPTYNRARYLAATLESVLTQQGDHELDVIVVDNGSTDNTAEVVERFSSSVRYRRIKPTGRPAIPRNIGIEMAQADLVAFQDSDDLWTSDKLALQLPALMSANAVLSYGNAEVITEAGARTGETVIASGQSGAIFHELLETNFISTLTVIARKDALVALGGFDESSRMYGVEDYELWLRIAATGEPIEYVDQTLALYRRHADNMSRADELGSLKTLTHAFRATLNADLSGEQRAAVRARLYRLYLSRSNYSRGLERAKDLAAAKLYQARAGT